MIPQNCPTCGSNIVNVEITKWGQTIRTCMDCGTVWFDKIDEEEILK